MYVEKQKIFLLLAVGAARNGLSRASKQKSLNTHLVNCNGEDEDIKNII